MKSKKKKSPKDLRPKPWRTSPSGVVIGRDDDRGDSVNILDRDGYLLIMGVNPYTADEIVEAVNERDRLYFAIHLHHDQHADDLCWQDDDALYAAAGLPPRDHRVGNKAVQLMNCVRFLERRCESGGPWRSYAELEAENARLKIELDKDLD